MKINSYIFTGEQQELSSTDEQQREQQELSSSSSSNKQQREKIHSSSSESSLFISSSSNTPVSDITVTDISRSTNELPTQPKLASYRLNKDKRCFRSQWFSQLFG